MDEATQEYQGAEEQQQTESPSGEKEALLQALLAQEQGQQYDETDGAPDPAGQATDGQDPTADLFTVKINGQDKQVTRDELIASYQKGEASGQRFEEAAAIRREAEAQKAQFIQNQQVLAEAINHFQSQAQRLQMQPPSLDLLETNPHEYLKQEAQYKLYQEEMGRAQQAQQYLYQMQEQQRAEVFNQHLTAEKGRLLDLIPEWKNDQLRGSEEKELVEYLRGEGYSDQDLMQLNHSRASNIKLALNAMRYNKLVQEAKGHSKRVSNLPPRMEKSLPRSGSKSEYSDARARLAKSGSITDATAALAALFE